MIRHLLGLPTQMAQQSLIQALAHLQIWIIQGVEGLNAIPFLIHYGQVAGLEQQRIDADVPNIEPGQLPCVRAPALQLHRAHLPVHHHPEQEGRGAGLEPVGLEVAGFEKQQQVVRVVELLVTKPVVAVVPLSDPLPVEPPQFRGEHGFQIGIGITADAGVLGVEADVAQVVETRKETHPGEHADPGDEGKADIPGAVLDDAVEPP